MIAESPPVALKVYGHNTMYALRATGGFLCFSFWAMPDEINVVLFSDPKTAKGWLTKARKAGWQLEASPQNITTHPANMRVAINPADDAAAIGVILKKSFYRNW